MLYYLPFFLHKNPSLTSIALDPVMYCAPTSDAVRIFLCMNGWQPFIDLLKLKVIRTVKVSKHKQQENCWVA